MGGDYLRYQHFYGRLPPTAANHAVAAADTATITLVADRANFTTYIQRIAVSVTTDAAQTLLFQDRAAGTPVPIAKTKSSPGLGEIAFDFGPEGLPLTEEKGLDMVISGAGLAGFVHVEGYQRLTKTTSAPSTT